MTQSPPSFTAFVVSAATSLPPPGSLTPASLCPLISQELSLRLQNVLKIHSLSEFQSPVSQGRRAQAEESIPGDGGRQEVPLELVAAVLRERRRGHVGVHADPHAHAAAPDVTRRL